MDSVGEFPYIVQVKQRGGGTIEPNDVLALLGRMKLNKIRNEYFFTN